MSNKPTIAFFGSTGGVASTALALALREGYTCTALVRTPSKLHDLLTKQHSIPASTISTHLTIHSGDIKDPDAVSKALIAPQNSSTLVSKILFGVGSLPKLQVSLLRPVTINDPTVCEDGMKSVMSALSQLSSAGISVAAEGTKPLIVAISTTGLDTKRRDVPIPMNLLYRWILAVPHEDKKKMEEVLINDSGVHVRNFVIVKPAAFTDGEGKGHEKVRAGWVWGTERKEAEREKEVGPMLGFTIDKKDVGEWIFRSVIADGTGSRWEGKCVSLCY